MPTPVFRGILAQKGHTMIHPATGARRCMRLTATLLVLAFAWACVLPGSNLPFAGVCFAEDPPMDPPPDDPPPPLPGQPEPYPYWEEYYQDCIIGGPLDPHWMAFWTIYLNQYSLDYTPEEYWQMYFDDFMEEYWELYYIDP
jgi:hypothetical protein